MESDKATHFRQKTDEDVPIVETFSLSDNSTLKVALQPGYSIELDDSPSKLQIRIMDKRQLSPPRIQEESSRSPKWMADYGPPRWDGESNRVVRGKRPPGQEAAFRARDHMQEEIRNDLPENAGEVALIETCERCRGIDETTDKRIVLRRPSAHDIIMNEERGNSSEPSASFSSPNFVDGRRKNQNCKRNNLITHDPDFHEMHKNLPSRAQPHPQAQADAPSKMPPEDAYNPENYTSPPGSQRSASPGRCTWHRGKSCPVKAGYRCRENTGYESPVSEESVGGGSDSEQDRCSYHRKLTCPATAGVHCRSDGSISPPRSNRTPQDESNKGSGSKQENNFISNSWHLPLDDSNNGSRSKQQSIFISNSCKCQGEPVRLLKEEIVHWPPKAESVPVPSCKCATVVRMS